MFEAFSRSWEITKLSLEVIKKDKELLLFPILSGIFSIIFMIAILFPAIIGPMVLGLAGGEAASTIAIYLSIFVVYLGLAIIATFFNVCTVYTVKVRFENKNATFSESIKFAVSRMHLIFAWGLLSATVGLILRIIEDSAEKAGGLTRTIIGALTGLIGMAWSVITIFVVPSMVYKGLGPMDAIKSSVNVLKKTWGESLIRHFGTGLISLVFYVLGAIAFFFLFIFSLPFGPIPAIIVGSLALIYFVAVATMFSLINNIFNTALYVYAEHGKVPVFKPEVLKGAFKRNQ